MRICAEALFALNAVIDTGLLACSARICGAPLRWKRLAAAGALGGAYTVAAMLPEGSFLRHGLVQLSAAGFLGLTAFGASRRLFRLELVFLALGCCFAGSVFALTQVTGTGLLRLAGGGYYPVSAAALLSLGGMGLAVCRLLFSSCAQHTARGYEMLTIHLDGRSVRVRALVDTGNTLKDPITNEPVLIIDAQAASRLLPELHLREDAFFSAPELLRRIAQEKPNLRPRLIPYRAVGVQQGLLLAVRCQVQREDGRQRPAIAAFSPTPVSSNGEFEALTGGAA